MLHIHGVVEWMSALANSSRAQFGFDGIVRKYPRLDRSQFVNPDIQVATLEFHELLLELSKLDRRGGNFAPGVAPNPADRTLNGDG